MQKTSPWTGAIAKTSFFLPLLILMIALGLGIYWVDSPGLILGVAGLMITLTVAALLIAWLRERAVNPSAATRELRIAKKSKKEAEALLKASTIKTPPFCGNLHVTPEELTARQKREIASRAFTPILLSLGLDAVAMLAGQLGFMYPAALFYACAVVALLILSKGQAWYWKEIFGLPKLLGYPLAIAIDLAIVVGISLLASSREWGVKTLLAASLIGYILYFSWSAQRHYLSAHISRFKPAQRFLEQKMMESQSRLKAQDIKA